MGKGGLSILPHPWVVSRILSESIEGLRGLGHLNVVEKQAL